MTDTNEISEREPVSVAVAMRGHEYYWPGKLPKGYGHMKPNQCFLNAQRLLQRRHYTGLRYVEGFVYADAHGEFPLHHAWLIDDGDQVIDPTLPGAVKLGKRRYAGIVFTTGEFKDAWFANMRRSVIEQGSAMTGMPFFYPDSSDLEAMERNVIMRQRADIARLVALLNP